VGTDIYDIFPKGGKEMPPNGDKVKAYFEMSIEEILEKDTDEIVRWNATQFVKHVSEHQGLKKKVVNTAVKVATGVTTLLVAIMWMVKIFSNILGR